MGLLQPFTRMTQWHSPSPRVAATDRLTEWEFHTLLRTRYPVMEDAEIAREWKAYLGRHHRKRGQAGRMRVSHAGPPLRFSLVRASSLAFQLRGPPSTQNALTCVTSGLSSGSSGT